MSEEAIAPSLSDSPTQDLVLVIKLLLSDYITSSKKDIADLRSAVTLLTNRKTPEKSVDSPIIDRTGYNRRSSMFFGSPTVLDYQGDSKKSKYYKTIMSIRRNSKLAP